MIGPPPSLHPSRQNVWAAATTDCNGWLACLAWEREPVVRNWKPLESIPSPVSSLSLFPLMSWLSLIHWILASCNTTPHHLHPNQSHQALGLKLASIMRCICIKNNSPQIRKDHPKSCWPFSSDSCQQQQQLGIDTQVFSLKGKDEKLPRKVWSQVWLGQMKKNSPSIAIDSTTQNENCQMDDITNNWNNYRH